MALKTKLIAGLAFLFFIILSLIGFYAYHLGKLSQESGNILKNNYASIVYSRNMLLALENMRTAAGSGLFSAGAQARTDYASDLFASGKAEFDENLKAEKDNITEMHEEEGVDLLAKQYDLFLSLCDHLPEGARGHTLYFSELMPAYEKLKHSIVSIEDLNMQAVERKNQLVQQDAARMMRITAIITSICIVLALGYFWYFPFYVSTSLSYLSGRMQELLKKAGVAADFRTEDEASILLQSINLLEATLSSKQREKAGG